MGKPAPAHLTTWFPPDEVLKALLNDSAVQKALPPNSHISSLQNLIDAVAGNPIEIGDADNFCRCAFGTDLLENFAFYDFDGRSVSVRLSLSHAVEICRGDMIQVGLVLPAPTALRQSLENAEKRRAGFLDEESNLVGR